MQLEKYKSKHQSFRVSFLRAAAQCSFKKQKLIRTKTAGWIIGSHSYFENIYGKTDEPVKDRKQEKTLAQKLRKDQVPSHKHTHSHTEDVLNTCTAAQEH